MCGIDSQLCRCLFYDLNMPTENCLCINNSCTLAQLHLARMGRHVIRFIKMSIFKLASFCVVTGASRGLGKEISLQLAQGWSREGELRNSAAIISARLVELANPPLFCGHVC